MPATTTVIGEMSWGNKNVRLERHISTTRRIKWRCPALDNFSNFFFSCAVGAVFKVASRRLCIATITYTTSDYGAILK